MIANSRPIALQREQQPPNERQQSSRTLLLPTLSPSASGWACAPRALATATALTAAVAAGDDRERVGDRKLHQNQYQYVSEHRDRSLEMASTGERALEPEVHDVNAEDSEVASGTDRGAQEHLHGPNLLVVPRSIPRSHGRESNRTAEQQPTSSNVPGRDAEGGLQADTRAGLGETMLLIPVRVQEVSNPSTIARGSLQTAESRSSFGDVRLLRVQTPARTKEGCGDSRGEGEDSDRRWLSVASGPLRYRQGSVIGDYLPCFEYGP